MTTTTPSTTFIAENAKRQLSTNYDPSFARSAFMATVVSTDDGSVWIDPLDQRLLNLLNGDIPYDAFSYRSESITTISFRYYRTTSLWWLIVMFNGFIHPHEIPSGYVLKIPKLSYILSKVKKPVKDSIKGKIIRV